MKRRLISLFLCIGLLFSGCVPENMGQAEQVESDLVSMNPTPDLSYEVPVVVPHILVDQVGYSTNGEKTAIFRGDDLPEEFEVVNVESGEVVFSGTIKEKERENAAGESIGYGDFTELTEEGTYYLQSSVFGRSYDFQIGEDVYDLAYSDAITLLSERQEKKINVTIPTEAEEPAEKIIQGGWYTDEAGNQDLKVASEVMMVLLTAYELYPASFEDSATTTSNPPRLLAYLKQQTEWMQMLQDETIGGVYGGILVESDKTIPTYRMIEMDLEASACYAAALAKFSYVYKKYDQEYAAQCLKAADRAWKYIDKQQKNTGEDRETAPSDTLFSAAAELYRASGQQTYHLPVKQILEEGVNPGESTWATYGTITYLTTRHYVNVDYCGVIMKQLMTYAEDISARARASAYLTEGNVELDNTKELLWNMVILSVADYVITNHEYATVIENHQHYFFGCNSGAVCLVNEEGCDSLGAEGSGIQDDLQMNAYYICMMSQIMKE